MLLEVCDNYPYFTFDNPILLNEVKNETNLFLKNNLPPILLDEVQYAPEIFRYIKMFVDKNKKLWGFCINGVASIRINEGCQ